MWAWGCRYFVSTAAALTLVRGRRRKQSGEKSFFKNNNSLSTIVVQTRLKNEKNVYDTNAPIMGFKPIWALGLLIAQSVFYMAMLSGDSWTMQTFGVEKKGALKFMCDWLAFGISWGTSSVVILTFLNRSKSAKLRKLCTFVQYCLCAEMAAIVFSGPKSAGGLMIDSEHLTNLIFNFVMLLVTGAAISSGPSAVPSGEFFFKPSSAAKTGVIVCFFAMTFWYFDVCNLGGMAKYMTSYPSNDGYLFNANRWFVLVIAETMFYMMFAIAYGDDADRRALLAYNIVNNGITEFLVRKGHLGSMMTEEAKQEGTMMRIGLTAVCAICIGLSISGKKKKA